MMKFIIDDLLEKVLPIGFFFSYMAESIYTLLASYIEEALLLIIKPKIVHHVNCTSEKPINRPNKFENITNARPLLARVWWLNITVRVAVKDITYTILYKSRSP